MQLSSSKPKIEPPACKSCMFAYSISFRDPYGNKKSKQSATRLPNLALASPLRSGRPSPVAGLCSCCSGFSACIDALSALPSAVRINRSASTPGSGGTASAEGAQKGSCPSLVSIKFTCSAFILLHSLSCQTLESSFLLCHSHLTETSYIHQAFISQPLHISAGPPQNSCLGQCQGTECNQYHSTSKTVQLNAA
jgi:hypothetical protein